MLVWTVTYKDKTTHEYAANEFSIANIDPEKLDVISFKDPNALIPTFILHFDDKRKKPIYVMRRQLPNAKQAFETRCHMVGWQIKGTDIQSINYVFETIGRKIMVTDDTHPAGKKEIIQEMCWIESAGKWDRSRDSWFNSPSQKQLSTLGSRAEK